MYFKFPCQNCGKKLKVDEEHAGRKVRCPFCKTSQVVPEPPHEDEESGGDGGGDGFGGAEDLLAGLAGLGAAPGEGGESAAAGGVATEQAAGVAASGAAGKQAAGGESESGTRSRRGAEDSNTDVSGIKSGLIGLALTGVLYTLLYPFQETVGVLFYGRGWVPVATTVLMGWALGILILKYGKLRRQRDSMLFDMIPTEIGNEITAQNLPQFIAHVRELPMDASRSFLISRVHRGLDHFRVRRSINEVSEMLQSQSDIDRNAVASSYSLLNVFLWAIPILGFIGTVLGISIAVGNFAGTMDDAGDLDAMKDSLGFVMGGLGTAFDTTLLALVFAVLLIFPMKSMQKAEEDLLDWVDEYTNENLLKRLQDGSGGAGSDHQKQILKTINSAMANHHAELRAWSAKLESIGETFKQRASEEWTEIHNRLMEEHEKRETSLTETSTTFTEKQNTLLEQMNSLNEQIVKLQEQQSGQVTSVHTQMAESLKEAAESLRTYVNGMQEGLESLNVTLGELNGKTVVVESPRRGWFGRRKKTTTNGDN